jgi:hypothetical protein
LDYHLTYLQCVFLLLADVFENFPITSLETYELDPSHYLSAPASDTNKYGHRVEIDFSFPEEIHDDVKEFVPAPENIKSNIEWLSDYQK